MTITKKEVVAGIYTCLEMLRFEREDLVAWWCNLLYTNDGNVHLPMWNESTLLTLENDVAYYG